MTTKELIVAMCDAGDAGAEGIGVYEPALTNATRDKRGATILTFKLRVTEFTPNDALTGIKAYLAVGRVDKLRQLLGATPTEET